MTTRTRIRTRPRVEILEDRTTPTTFVVTTAADAGAGSLRQAILDANTNANPATRDTINFNIPGTGVKTIALASALPAIDESVTIDGATQPGVTRNTLAVGNNANLLIEIDGSGLAAGDNGFGYRASNVTIRNMSIHGFRVASGLGFAVVDFSDNGPVNNPVVEGCWLGIRPDGTLAPQAGAGPGIFLRTGSNGRVGGTDAAQRNVIAGFTNGINIGGDAFTIQNNYIGTNPAGTSVFGNSGSGILLNGGATNALVGGLDPRARNVIGGSTDQDIRFISPSTGNVIQGNYLGVGADGTTPIAAATGRGITVQDGVTGNTIGGTTPGAGNVVANHAEDGVVFLGTASGNTIWGNRIFSNGGLGIDLNDDGPTANDAGDADTGPNGLQNFPVIGPATVAGSVSTVKGTLNSTPNATFEIEVFANSVAVAADAEGETFLGRTTVTTDAAGNAAFTVTGVALPLGTFVTATVTATATGDTSEFSAAVAVTAPSATLRGTAFDDGDNDGVRDAGESGVGGRPVLLDANGDGTFDAVTTTDTAGNYVFSGLAPGSYVVTFVPADGAKATTATSFGTTLADGDDVTTDFGGFTPVAPPAAPGLLVRSAAGTAASSIQAAVDAFRADLGTLNPNAAGSFGGGRREINWDGVPAQFAAPNNLPANFFNANSPRGVEFTFPPGSGGTDFQVSGRAADAGVGQPDVRFSTVNATYNTEFKTFSAERLFAPLGANAYDVVFFVPGTSVPAKVRGFGAVFADAGGSPSTIELFGPGGQSLGVFTATPADGGLSFLGVLDSTEAGVARVRVTTGNSPLGPNDGGGIDVVALDDFIFGEPVPINTAPGIGDVVNQPAGGTVPVTVFDAETPAANLQLAAVSSDPTLFPAGSLVVGGTGASRTLTLTPAAGVFGTATITLTVTDAGGLTATDTFGVTVTAPVVPLPPAPQTRTDLFAVGSGPGIAATVEVFNADGSKRFTLRPYGDFAGGVAVGTGDLTGDGIDDVVTGAGPGGAPHIKVFDGATGAEVASFFAYADTQRGGVFVGLGDVTGDGWADVVTGAGFGGAPHVKVFDGRTFAAVRSFFAFDSAFRGGVTVRAGDVDGDGFADVVAGAGPGAAPHVKVFSGTDLTLLDSFFAFDPGFTGGVFVGVANLVGDARAEVLASANGRVLTRGYVEQDNLVRGYVEQDNLVPIRAGIPTGIAAVRQPDGIIAILIGAAPGGGGPQVKVIDSTGNTVRSSFFAFDPAFAGGVFVG